jgi:hypothetical protein
LSLLEEAVVVVVMAAAVALVVIAPLLLFFFRLVQAIQLQWVAAALVQLITAVAPLLILPEAIQYLIR